MTLYKIVLLGEGGVGKSCLTIQFTQNYFVREYDPTIENSYRKQLHVDDEACILDILDTAGQEEYSVMRDQYIHSGHGFILVYSVCCRSSFLGIQGLHEKVLQVKDSASFPMVLVGNKSDIEERVISFSEGKELAGKWGVPFLESSAKLRINVEEAFMVALKEIRKFREPVSSLPKRAKRKSMMDLTRVFKSDNSEKHCTLL